MSVSRILILLVLAELFVQPTLAQNPAIEVTAGDSLTLSQAFVNLSLTQQYFNTLQNERVTKIIPYEENELKSIFNPVFIKGNMSVFNLSQSLLELNKVKLLFRTKTDSSRNTLLQWKELLAASIQHFNDARLNTYFNEASDPSPIGDYKRSFNEFIGLHDTLAENIKIDLRNIRAKVVPYFNQNIYTDFQRIFYSVTQTEQLKFDSLAYYTSLFNLPLSRHILDMKDEERKRNLELVGGVFRMNNVFNLDKKLELISKYLQLYYLSGKESKSKITPEEQDILYNNYSRFNDDLEYYFESGLADSFFKKEINSRTSKSLFNRLKKRYSLEDTPDKPKHMALPSMIGNESGGGKYFFPIPAPRPSALLYIDNFKPALNTYKQVDNYLGNIFNSAGYSGRMHYYYVTSGYAVTTSLEKINEDGSPASGDQRWAVSVSGNGSFSLYQTFKSIFFETESNFRIFALIMSPVKATVQSSASSLAAINELIQYSYPSLPRDLEDVVPPSKTLSVLVYQYKQSDVGKVPMLEIKNPIPVKKHLTNSRLGALLNP